MSAPVSLANFAEDGSIVPPITASRRADGWTPERQRSFLEFVAAGHTVDSACRCVGLSPQSAYAFRARAAGAAFAIGWHAAHLLQRQKLADALTARALDGQTVTTTRADGTTVERHFFDNRLATTMLARADRLAAGDAPDRFGEGQAARLAAGEWERFLDIVAAPTGSEGSGPAQAGQFLALRRDDADSPGDAAAIDRLARADRYGRTGKGLPAEIDTADLDLAARAGWTAEQWSRAEAAGLLQIAAPAAANDDEQAGDPDPQLPQHSLPDRYQTDFDAPVWWDEPSEAWRTRFPPPDDFEGEEEHDYGHPDYERALTAEEEDRVEAGCHDTEAERHAAETAERAAFFAWLAATVAEHEAEAGG